MGSNGAHKHHALFYRAEWTARDDAKKVRENFWLKIPLEDDAHRELHRNVQYVPTLGRHLMALVKRDYVPVKGDYLGSVEALMADIAELSTDRRVSSLETQVGRLAVYALELQLPYLKEGLIEE